MNVRILIIPIITALSFSVSALAVDSTQTQQPKQNKDTGQSQPGISNPPIQDQLKIISPPKNSSWSKIKDLFM